MFATAKAGKRHGQLADVSTEVDVDRFEVMCHVTAVRGAGMMRGVVAAQKWKRCDACTSEGDSPRKASSGRESGVGGAGLDWGLNCQN